MELDEMTRDRLMAEVLTLQQEVERLRKLVAANHECAERWIERADYWHSVAAQAMRA